MNDFHRLKGDFSYEEWLAGLSISSKFYNNLNSCKKYSLSVSKNLKEFNIEEFNNLFNSALKKDAYSCEQINKVWKNSTCIKCPYYKKIENPLDIEEYPTKKDGFRFFFKGKRGLDDQDLLTYTRYELGYKVSDRDKYFVKTTHGFYERLSSVSKIISDIGSLVWDPKLTATEINNLKTKLKNTNLINEDVECIKSWGVFIFRNGFFDFNKSLEFKPLKDLEEDSFVTYGLDFDYNPDASCEDFKSFLEDIFLDGDSIQYEELDAFSRYIGLSLFGTEEQRNTEKMMLLYGTGANGKSTVMSILKLLFERSNVIAPFSPDSVKSDYKFLMPLKFAKIGYCSDLSTSSFEKGHEVIKNLVSKEVIPYRGNYQEAETGFKIRANLICSTNCLPPVTEATEGFARRFLIINFKNRIKTEKRKMGLAKDIYKREKQGIFNYFLNSYKSHLDLIKKQDGERVFFNLASSRALLKESMDIGSPVRDFVSSRLVILDMNSERGDYIKDIYKDYVKYIRVNNPKEDILSKKLLIRRIFEAFNLSPRRYEKKREGYFLKGIVFRRDDG